MKITCMKDEISIESRVVMSLQRLEIENTLCIIREVYGMAEIAISKIMSFFLCRLVRVHL